LGSMGAAALAGQMIRTVGARQPGRRTAGREAAVALVSVAPALLALRSGDLAAYHGVEHKAIAGYEEGSDAADAAKEHDRCGSHLVAPMLAAATLRPVVRPRAASPRVAHARAGRRPPRRTARPGRRGGRGPRQRRGRRRDVRLG